jgi:IPT/TIG domain
MPRPQAQPAIAARATQPAIAARAKQIALALLAACAATLALSPSSWAVPSKATYRAQRECATPRHGFAACLGLRLVAKSLSNATLSADATRQAEEVAGGVQPAVSNKSPLGGYTPQTLHTAYSLPSETSTSMLQTIALVDAFNDPSAEADLGVYDKQFGLPACTSANGCFTKINQQGHTSPLPSTQGGWATEESLDVQMAHAICQQCRILLVEASNESFANLGAAVDEAVAAGATEISNSYGGAESSSYASLNAPYNHPGVVVTVSSGDCGYFNQACGGAAAANFPASSPDVVAVGGTSLSETGRSWSSTVWDDGGSGCSVAFSAPLWQSTVASFSATGCSSARSVADVAANADPYTGVDVYDSTPAGNGDPTGWGVWGGTSEASPIVAAEFALAGGSHGAEYPAATLYSNDGDASALTDVVSGSNGSCESTSCRAGKGYDGPTGVGSPHGLSAFAAAGSPTSVSAPSISGASQQEQQLSVSHGGWTASPTSYSEQWALCNAAGASCSAVAGATGSTYTIPASDLGLTIRVQETASNASGGGAPAVSAHTVAVASNAPTISRVTPASGVTGSSVTIAGTGLGAATKVKFGSLTATFAIHSATQIEATVPNGASAATISVTTPIKSVTSTARFTPTLSLTGVSPTKAAPAGNVVTITGIGFNSGSSVSFNGVAATSVTHVSATKLKATIPASAGTGAITVTNTATPKGTVASATSFTAS